MNFLLRLIDYDKSSVQYDVYSCCIDMHECNIDQNWLSIMNNILKLSSYSNPKITENINDIKNTTEKLTLSLKNIYISQWKIGYQQHMEYGKIKTIN